MIATLYTQTPQFFGDICEEIRLFIDTRKIEKAETPEPLGEGFFVLHEFAQNDSGVQSSAKVFENGKQVSQFEYTCLAGQSALEQKRNAKRAAKISMYRALAAHFGTKMPWGSLTGIRPTKLLRDSEARLGRKSAKSLFLDEFDVSPQKYDFAKRIVDVQAGLVPKNSDDIDVYIGIPFCVTRCAYCSFASSTPDVFKDAEQQYVNALMDELSMAEQLLVGRNVRAMYVGGGTPTAVSAANLERILERAAKIGKDAIEFTVEAGRPDTMTREKLKIIKDSGARRISVNTQTLVDATLQRIGRAHTAQQFFEAYALTEQIGFDAINVDVIAGLPGETAEDMKNTLRRIIELSPDNITVHTLAIKRASVFAKDNLAAFPTSTQTTGMLSNAQHMLKTAGYRAYYMYRQKYMKGSMENAGFAMPDKECIYNIDNMEEVCDVAAFGAGAISKRVYFGTRKDVGMNIQQPETRAKRGLHTGEGRIERAANVKDLREYIARCGEMRQRKRDLFE